MFKAIFETIGFILALFLITNGIYGFTCEHVLISFFGDVTGTAVVSYIAGVVLLMRGAGKCIFSYLVHNTMNDD